MEEQIGILIASGTTIGSTLNVKTQINAGKVVKLPKWARQIVSIKPSIAVDVYDADLTAIAKVTLESKDVAIEPCIVLTNPISGYDATSGQPFQPKSPEFIVNCEVKGGEEISVYGTLLQSFTGPAYVACNIKISDQLPTKRQRYYEVGTITETGTAAAEVKATAYDINGCEKIVEAIGMVMTEIHDAENAIIGSFRITSNGFKETVPIEYGMQPISGCISTVQGAHLMGLSRFKVEVDTYDSCRLQDYATFDLAPTVHGFFITGVAFYKVGR